MAAGGEAWSRAFSISGLVMLLAILGLVFANYKTSGVITFDYFALLHAAIDPRLGFWLMLGFFVAFLVKLPGVPFHTWLPDAHTQAPTAGSVILAGILLKTGAYGFLRFNLPIAPDASHVLAGFMITLSLIAVVYIGFVALAQTDMKKLVAYSSISHMGFVTLGFFIFNAQGMEGGLAQMISHGFISAAMFLCIGVLYDRVHSREISAYGGVMNTMPKFAFFAVFFGMANAGLPATSGFVGEFMVILGAIKVNFWYAFLAATYSRNLPSLLLVMQHPPELHQQHQILRYFLRYCHQTTRRPVANIQHAHQALLCSKRKYLHHQDVLFRLKLATRLPINALKYFYRKQMVLRQRAFRPLQSEN